MLDNTFVLGDLKLPADKGRLPCPLWVGSCPQRHPRPLPQLNGRKRPEGDLALLKPCSQQAIVAR